MLVWFRFLELKLSPNLLRSRYFSGNWLASKFGALAQMIPSPVLGGAMLVLFGMAALQGMQMLNRVDFKNNEYNFIIAAVSISQDLALTVQTSLPVFRRQHRCS